MKRVQARKEEERQLKELELRKLGVDGEVVSQRGSIVGEDEVGERSVDGVMRDVELGGREEGGEGKGFKWWRR